MQSTYYKITIFIGFMENYTKEMLSICRAYNIDPQEVLFCFALASNAPAADCYRLLFKVKSSISVEECAIYANNLLNNKPALKVLINKIKNHKAYRPTKEDLQEMKEGDISDDVKNELRTREGLIQNLITSVAATNGKDKISGLQTLAKLQGFDKPDENEQQEQRKYFLPYVSHCRTCKLMEVYRKILHDGGKPTE